MSRTWLRAFAALFAVIFVMSACSSTADQADADATTDEATADEVARDEHGHSSIIEVNPDLPLPVIDMSLAQTDTPGLFAISVEVTNFTIAPDKVDLDPVDGEGHMHLLIDGTKVERFTELEWEVQVPEGEHLVEVELSANNHSAYAIDGAPIRASATVEGAGEWAYDTDDSHDHDHDHSTAGPAIEEGLTAEDATTTITATYAGGGVTVDGNDRVEVAVGDVVMIMVESDVAEEVHLHGYDLLASIDAGGSAMILFTADTAGVYEVEFESSGAFIVELVVS